MNARKLSAKGTLLCAVLIVAGTTAVDYGFPRQDRGGSSRIFYGDEHRPAGPAAFYIGAALVAIGTVGIVRCHRYGLVVTGALLGAFFGGAVFGTVWVSQHRQLFTKGSSGPNAQELHEMMVIGAAGAIAGATAVLLAAAGVSRARRRPSQNYGRRGG